MYLRYLPATDISVMQWLHCARQLRLQQLSCRGQFRFDDLLYLREALLLLTGPLALLGISIIL
jgi:hypothetical protein